MKNTLFILYLFISMNVNSQIGLSYSIGSIGGMSNASASSVPISIYKKNCYIVASNVSRFWPTKKGEFFASCMVDLDYIKLSIKISPNPVFTYTNIKFLNMIQSENQFKLIVYNNTGQPTISKEVTQDAFLAGYKLDMSTLSSGYYFIQIASNSILQTFKILKN